MKNSTSGQLCRQRKRAKGPSRSSPTVCQRRTQPTSQQEKRYVSRTSPPYDNAIHGFHEYDWTPPSFAEGDGVAIPTPTPANQLCARYSELRPTVIAPLLRRTEIANIIASPKIGKTYLALDMAMSVAAGKPWLGQFQTRLGRFLYVDCELHKETLAHRI